MLEKDKPIEMMETAECLRDVFKLKTGLLAGIDRCIDDFEDKRT